MGKNIVYQCEICGAEMTSETIYQLHASKCIVEVLKEVGIIEDPIIDPDVVKDPIKVDPVKQIPTPRKAGK